MKHLYILSAIISLSVSANIELIINENKKDDQNFHAGADFLEKNYGISYDQFFSARDSGDYSELAEIIYNKGSYSPLVNFLPGSPVSLLDAFDVTIRKHKLSDSIYKKMHMPIIEATLMIIGDGGPGSVGPVTYSRGLK